MDLVKPPSTQRSWPVTKLDSGLIMNSIALAMSLGSPILANGIRASRARLIAGSAYILADIGVWVMPGETTLTRMPSAAHSRASVCASMVSAAFVGLYAPDPSCGSCPDIEDVKQAVPR